MGTNEWWRHEDGPGAVLEPEEMVAAMRRLYEASKEASPRDPIREMVPFEDQTAD